MSDRPDMVVPSIEGERWGELGARLTPQQRAAAVDALVGKLATRAMIDPDDLCPHCGATQGVCSDAMSEQCRDWTRIANPGQSVGWRCNTHGDGPYVGDPSPYLCRVGRAAETARILSDLIAELRQPGAGYWMEVLVNRAEARLREVSPEFPEGATVADVSMSLSKGHDDE